MTSMYKTYECGHVVHPIGNPLPSRRWCPSCWITTLLQAVNTTAEAWKKEGGPYSNTEKVGDGYMEAKQDFRYWKGILLESMEKLEAFAEREHLWAIANAKDSVGLEGESTNFKSSEEALLLAKKNMPFCDVLDSDFDTSKVTSSKRKKSVRFVEDTTIVDSSQRSLSKYARGPEVHEPGRWAAVTGHFEMFVGMIEEGFGAADWQQ